MDWGRRTGLPLNPRKNPMTSKEVLEAALRILVAYTSGGEPDPTHVEIVEQALSPCPDLPPDELACRAIQGIRAALNASPEPPERSGMVA
jgi:hypothetical protein